MNNLYKSFKLTALCAAVLGFAACHSVSNEDVLALDSQIANQTLQGIYTYIAVDSTAMNTTLYEWELSQDSTGARVGAYRVAASGNATDINTEDVLTWDEATMAGDYLSMSIPVVVKGEQKTLIWHDGVVTVDNYTTAKDLISKVSVLRSVHDNFANLDFVYDDTTNYITSRLDTMHYLAWKTEVVSYTQEQIDAYKQYMIDMHDTIMWFNATYPNRAVPDTVRFSTKQQADGTYKGQISTSYPDMEITTIYTNHGPLHIINSEMVFNREADGSTPASYVFYEKIWNEEFYKNPSSDKAEHTEYVLELTNAKWTPTFYTNIKKFNVLLKGKYHLTYKDMIKDEMITSDDQENYPFELQLSGFNRLDGEVVLEEHKYKTK